MSNIKRKRVPQIVGTCVHEAGHIIGFIHSGIDVDEVWVRPFNPRLGFTQAGETVINAPVHCDDWDSYYRAEARGIICGPLAEESSKKYLEYPDEDSLNGSHGDFEMLETLKSQYASRVGRPFDNALYEQTWREASALLRRHQGKVYALAGYLRKYRHLYEDSFREIYRINRWRYPDTSRFISLEEAA